MIKRKENVSRVFIRGPCEIISLYIQAIIRIIVLFLVSTVIRKREECVTKRSLEQGAGFFAALLFRGLQGRHYRLIKHILQTSLGKSRAFNILHRLQFPRQLLALLNRYSFLSVSSEFLDGGGVVSQINLCTN